MTNLSSNNWSLGKVNPKNLFQTVNCVRVTRRWTAIYFSDEKKRDSEQI